MSNAQNTTASQRHINITTHQYNVFKEYGKMLK
jgi:hypothetical protein